VGVHLQNLSEIDELTITTEQGTKVYQILTEHQEDYLAYMWRVEFEDRWGEGRDVRELARLVLKAAYRWHEKVLYKATISPSKTIEMCLDLYVAGGIEPPAFVRRGTTHGG
jgi:hypothetical protein